MRGPLALAAVVLSFGGCGDPVTAVDPDAPLLHTVQPYRHDTVVLDLTGAVHGGASEAVSTPIAWVPMEWVAPEGTVVAPGESLLRYEEETLRDWLGKDEVALVETRARAERDRLAAASDLADAIAERRRLEADIQVQDAVIEASLEAETERIAIARVRLAGLERQLEQARDERARLQPLVAAGFASPRRLEVLEERIERLAADLEPVRIELADLEATTNSVTRARARIERAKLALRLTAEAGDLPLRIADLEQRASETAHLSELEAARQVRSYELKQEMLESRDRRAESAGVVEYASDELRPGAKLGSTALFVLDEDGLQVRFLIPEALRDALGTGAGTRAVITAPALPELELIGRVTSISATGEALETGIGLGFPVTVALATGGDQTLAIGMSVNCRLELPLGGERAVIPAWALSDVTEPRVTLPDGSERAVSGRLIGDRFVIEGGLDPGQAIVLPTTPPARDRTRITGRVDLAEAVGIGPESWRLELVSVVDDGSRVAAGETVATFVQAGGDAELEAATRIAHQRTEAAIDLERARRDVALRVARARIAWQEARLAQRRAEIDLFVERYASLEQRVAAARASLVQARLDRTTAQREANELDDEIVARSLSESEIRRRRTRATLADQSYTRAELEFVAQARSRDQIRIWELEEGLAEARERSDNALREYRLERERSGKALAEAQDRHDRQLERLEQERELLADLELSAPIPGRIYHTTDRWGRKLQIGNRLPSGDILRIETGPRRRIVFEVPVHFYERLHDRDHLAVVVPALDDARFQAPIVAVGHAFRSAHDAVEQLRIPGHIGQADRIFECTVVLDLDPTIAADLPPGVTAYVDL